MIGNVIDARTDRLTPHVDAVFEPSAHDDSRAAFIAGANLPRHFSEDVVDHPIYFVIRWAYGTTVRDALLRAEAEWPFPVTVYLYDLGSAPAGWRDGCTGETLRE